MHDAQRAFVRAWQQRSYQVRLIPVSTVPKTSTPLALPELDEDGMVPEQAVSASVAAAAARVSHLRICISLPASIAGDGLIVTA